MCSETMTMVDGSTLGQLFVDAGLHGIVFEVMKQQIGCSVINWRIIHIAALILE
jgi:hypothetical protein